MKVRWTICFCLLLLAGCRPARPEALPVPHKTVDMQKLNGSEEELTGFLPKDLARQAQRMKLRQDIQLPEGFRVLDWCAGDIGLDGVPDLAVVVEREQESEFGDHWVRVLLVLEQEQEGSYACKGVNGNLILSSMSGGVFGDPYAGISIENGVLFLSDYGGSSDRWGHTFQFGSREGELTLIRLETINYTTHTLYGVRRLYDWDTGRAQTWSYHGDGEQEELLLYDGRIAGGPFSFSLAKHGMEYWMELLPSYPLPAFRNFTFPGLSGWRADPPHSPEEQLDQVWKSRYPDLKRVELPCGPEIRENYERLLGYPIPDHYYIGPGQELYYDELIYGEDGVYTHEIRWDNEDKAETYCYSIVDAEGSLQNP